MADDLIRAVEALPSADAADRRAVVTSTPPPPLRPLRPLPARRRHGRRLLWLVIVLAVAGVGYLLLRESPVAVDVGAVTTGDVHVVIEADGETHVVRRHTLVAPATGVLPRLTLQPGDSVQAGQVVATIASTASALLDPRARAQAEGRVGAAEAQRAQARTAATRARVALEQAERELGRAQQLAAAGAIAPVQVEQLGVVVRQRAEESVAAAEGVHLAEHELAAARAMLRATDPSVAPGQLLVRAPLTGVVLRVLYEVDGVVPAGTPLLEIGDRTTIEVRTDVLSDEATRLRLGAPARVVAATGDTAIGTIHRIAPAAFTKRSSLGVDEQRVRVAVRLATTARASAVPGDGYRVSVLLTVDSTGPTRVVPVGALVRQGATWAVYVVNNGRAVQQPVMIGARNAQIAQVQQGLAVGQSVVLYPTDAVADGRRVAARTK